MSLPTSKPILKPRPQMIVPEGEIMCGGHLACPGCGAPMSFRLAIKTLGPRTIVAGPACCWSVIDGPFPYSTMGVPFMHCAFETAAITAAGIRAGLRMKGITDVTVMAWAGDGGTYDIGLQALSGAAERNDDILYVCYDNEAYMNTGIQRSSATPRGAWTTTTPATAPKSQPKKDLDAILVAHRIPYLATATPAFPEDLVAKFRRAKDIPGTRFIHILSPCTAGWKFEEKDSVRLARYAVECGIFPLYEVEDGERYTLQYGPKGRPVDDFLRPQGRFRHMDDTARREFQVEVDENWRRLCARAGW